MGGIALTTCKQKMIRRVGQSGKKGHSGKRETKTEEMGILATTRAAEKREMVAPSLVRRRQYREIKIP